MNFEFEAHTVNAERRFGGLARLYGSVGAARIQAAHLVVVGLGGVGSWAAEAAARSGIARLTFVDFDHIAESNINRQIHATDLTVGQAKVYAMRDRVMSINPACRVDCVEEFVDTENWPDLVPNHLGIDRTLFAVIDACDQASAKTTIAAWAAKNEIFSITVGAAGGKRHAHLVDVDDVSAVTHDPLLAKLRYQLRKEHGAARRGKMNVACVFSREPVSKPLTLSTESVLRESEEHGIAGSTPDSTQAGGGLNCHGYGSVVSVTSTFGMCAASWVFNKLAGGQLD